MYNYMTTLDCRLEINHQCKYTTVFGNRLEGGPIRGRFRNLWRRRIIVNWEI